MRGSGCRRRQPWNALPDGSVRFQVIDAVCRNRHLGTVGTVDVLSLREIPQRELDVFARAANEPFEIPVEDARRSGVRPASSVEQFQHCQSQ